jgi:hypothetical protein
MWYIILVWEPLTGTVLSQFASSDPAALGGINTTRIAVADVHTVLYMPVQRFSLFRPAGFVGAVWDLLLVASGT